MKKISLKKLHLKEVEKLSREQLKNVLGGWTGETGVTSETGNEDCEYTCNCSDEYRPTINCTGMTLSEMVQGCANLCG